MRILKSGFRNSFEIGPGLSVSLKSIWLKAAMIIKKPKEAQLSHSVASFSLAAFAMRPLCALQVTGRKSVNVNVRSFRCIIIAGNIIAFSPLKNILARYLRLWSGPPNLSRIPDG